MKGEKSRVWISRAAIEPAMYYSSIGTLKYNIGPNGGYRLVLETPQDLSNYYFSLIPKYYEARPQYYNAHISVIRKEIPLNLEHWGKYDNTKISFVYDSYIHHGELYFWLNAYSSILEDIREELGLPVEGMSKPPKGLNFRRIFHITLANIKRK